MYNIFKDDDDDADDKDDESVVSLMMIKRPSSFQFLASSNAYSL